MTKLILLACVLGVPSVARGQTAEEIVAANIRASGGEEAIARVGNFTSKGRITVESRFFGKLEGTIEAVRVARGKARLLAALGGHPPSRLRRFGGTGA